MRPTPAIFMQVFHCKWVKSRNYVAVADAGSQRKLQLMER